VSGAIQPADHRSGPALVRVSLGGSDGVSLSPLQEAERAQAIADLQAEAWFRPIAVPGATSVAVSGEPLALRLSIAQRRLVFDIRRDSDDAPLGLVGLALGPFRSIIKDYRLLVDSHLAAVQSGHEERTQAIDMGRRGLHNEGAALVRERLAGKIDIDMATARRLFTLLCVLHQRDGDGPL
jgi:uncharacterized protein (UPF0262 family)